MSKVEIELNSEGVRALLRSPEMQAVLKQRADTIKGRAGKGYETHVWRTRATVGVVAVTDQAIADNAANNTLLKSLSGTSGRSGAVVHSHYRTLRSGKVVLVRSYQRKK